MSEVPAEEVVVYGDAPDGGGGGGTDTLSIPLETLTYYVPAGPTVINPPEPTGTGGGDTPPSGEEVAYWVAVGMAVVAMIPGAGEVEVAVGVSVKLAAQVGAVLAGATGHQLHNAGEKPPNKKYRGAPQVPARPVSLSSEALVVLRPWLSADRSVRNLVEVVRRAQGAFLAADVTWTERTALEAGRAWQAAGPDLLQLTNGAEKLLRQTGASSAGPVSIASVLDVLDEGAASVDCPELDEVKLRIARLLGTHPIPADPTRGLRALAARMTHPELVRVRFAFPRPVQLPARALSPRAAGAGRGAGG